MSHFKSKSQRRWGNSPEGIEALGGKENVAEWNKKTPNALPERVTLTTHQKALNSLKRGMKGNKR